MRATKIELLGNRLILTMADEMEAANTFLELRSVGDLEVTIKKFHKRRSLDANAYMWKLLGELAKKLETTSEELYRHYVSQYGIYKDFLLTESEAKTMIALWEKQGLGWPVEKLDFATNGDRVIYRAYYGTSVYTSKQLSRILDAVSEDAKEAGIETMTPNQLEILKVVWRNEKDNLSLR